ncbi:MAG: quinohemoprotein amine dehydrogenase subunit alpha [Acidobacteria bacterium]|nr:quinohemoprotein amine dehydrogenase subunit alpha [Acidobacteriota bacterium]
MAKTVRLSVVALSSAWAVALLLSASPSAQAPAPQAAATAKPDVGIPVTDQVVVKACSGCHRPDDKQQLSRISFRRTTPEGWERTITRMMALNNLKIDAQTARAVVKSLSNSHGLAPEEARRSLYEVERRLGDEEFKAADLNGTCDSCHALGRILGQQRTKQDWDLLISMHRGWYPIIDRQTFRRMGPAPTGRDASGRPPDMRHPSEKAADFLAETFPLQTKEWASWSASMRPARIDGTWTLAGWETSKGPIYGKVVLTPVAGTTDEFTTTTTFTYARSGEQVSRTGRVSIYTGFQWRGRSTVGGADASALREVMFVEPDWSAVKGRWFAGGYDELGIDVQLQRAGNAVTVVGLDHTALKTGSTGQALKIYVANPPAALAPRDLDFGPGVTVSAATVAGDVITATVDVAAAAAIGPRSLVVAGTVKPGAVTIYDKVDSLRVTPSWNMARVGGVVFPKMLARFDAWTFNNGPDRKPNTADDLRLDAVAATWNVEEYKATFDDEDIKFVGGIDAATSVFTPNVDGPNPQRKGERNNMGDVWVVASFTPPGAAAPLKGRSHLLVTAPLYMKFDPTVTP